MKLVVQRGVDESVGGALNDLIATQFAEDETLEVLDSAAVEALVDQDQQRQLLGCDAVSCLAEIGAAMGVDLLVDSSLSAIGNSYLLNIKVIDSKNVRVLRRVSKRIPNDEKFLLDGVIAAINELEGRTGKTPAAAEAPSHGAPAVAQDAPTPSAAPPAEAHAQVQTGTGSSATATIVAWSLMLVGAGSAVFGGVKFLQGLGNKSKGEQESNNDLLQQARVDLLQADIFGWGGAALIGTGLIVYMFTGDDSEPAAFAPMVGPDRVGMAATFRF
jgi:hypothetical protein